MELSALRSVWIPPPQPRSLQVQFSTSALYNLLYLLPLGWAAPSVSIEKFRLRTLERLTLLHNIYYHYYDQGWRDNTPNVRITLLGFDLN